MTGHSPMPIPQEPTDLFVSRHIGPTDLELSKMLETIGFRSMAELVDTAVPASIRMAESLDLGPERSESQLLKELAAIASENKVFRSFLGMGYHGCITPNVIQRNILDNPGWYTQYTPYQAEISQGRLEMLLNFQTMVSDLTGLPVANASLLDEGTAAAEAMSMSARLRPRNSEANLFLVSSDCHPQTIEIVRHRAEALGIEILEQDHGSFSFSEDVFGVLVQYPNTVGSIEDYESLCETAHAHGAKVIVAADILALTLLRPPGEFGADIAVGSTQRFGVPMGYGGPHAAFLATREEHQRQMPGRLIGISVDSQENPALRMALQTREQHIRRDRATSNICTAQVLLAVVAAAYAVYHGPEGLRAIANRIRSLTGALKQALESAGHSVMEGAFFDTLKVTANGLSESEVLAAGIAHGINLRGMNDGSVCISLDETVDKEDLTNLLAIFGIGESASTELFASEVSPLPEIHQRTSEFMTHPNFHLYHSETEMLRYIRRLESRDLSLTSSMIPLGSCTMKLNGTSEMIPITWPELNQLHPFVPVDQAKGYQRLFDDLERWLGIITGFPATSLQPNAGSQGEYAGLLVIRAYHQSRGEEDRHVCLIPTSAHGTNPASAVMAGMTVVAVRCDDEGNIDLDDLRTKAEKHQENLGALMITYPSTHGVFEDEIKTICSIIHEHGGQVYMDGANMNAQVGICRPGDIGADVCHLNLHKTFCIPHGGGGPGMGPICAASHLAPFLPGHPVVSTGGEKAIGAISAAPWGSPSILPISWTYIALMGSEGLRKATEVAIVNANYIAKRLEDHYPILYRGNAGLVAHECIIDLRPLKGLAGIQVDDVAKRLVDYGFHAPTMSWPVPGTMMIEPTESESKSELDRFCDAMIQIRQEIEQVANGELDQEDNPLKNAPHTAAEVTSDEWTHPYSRQMAAYPTAHTKIAKFWPPVGRVNNSYGDRNLVCTCPTVEEFVAE